MAKQETETMGYNSSLLQAGDVYTAKKPKNAPRDGGGDSGESVTKAELNAALRNHSTVNGDHSKKHNKPKKPKSEYGSVDNRSAAQKAQAFCSAFNSGACSLSKCGNGPHKCSMILTGKNGSSYVCGKPHAKAEHS